MGPTFIPTAEEVTLATQLIRGHEMMEVPGRRKRLEERASKEVALSIPRTPRDNATSVCKHECNLICSNRQTKQAHSVFTDLEPVKRILLRATAWQGGIDSAQCSRATVTPCNGQNRRPTLSRNRELKSGLLFLCNNPSMSWSPIQL